MTDVLQHNLDASGIRARLRVGPANVVACGDSLTTSLTTKTRFFTAFLRAFKWPLKGVYFESARVGGTGEDGFIVLHPGTGEDTRDEYSPTEAGEFGLVNLPSTPLLPTSRYERKWTADSANGDRIGEHEVEGDGVSKPGGTYEWGCGDWLSGQSVSVGLVYVKHPDGLDGVRLQTRIRAPSVNGGSGLNTDKVAIDTFAASVGIGETVAAFGDEVTGSVIPADWTAVGFKLAAPTDDTDETDKGLVKLYSHVFVDDAVDGVQFAPMAYSSLDAREYVDRTDPDLLAELIETMKSDTFIIMLGANDSADTSKAQYKADIQAVIDMIVTASATARGNDPTIRVPKFLLIAIYEVEGRAVMADYADALLEITQSEAYSDKAAFINLHKLAGAFNIIDATLLLDGTHQSEIGAITLAQMIWNEIDTVRPTVSGFAGDAAADIATLTSQTAAAQIEAALMDKTDGVESSMTLRQALRGVSAMLLAKVIGAGTDTVRVRDVNDTKDRLTVTADDNGNRNVVVRDLT